MGSSIGSILDYAASASPSELARDRRRWRSIRRFAVVGLILAFAGFRVHRQIRPAGATWYPPIISLTYGAVDGGHFTSPRGETVRIVFHDFGAAHRGNFWTWVIQDNALLGPRVLAEGFSAPEIGLRREHFPLRWNADGSFTARFLQGKTRVSVNVTP